MSPLPTLAASEPLLSPSSSSPRSVESLGVARDELSHDSGFYEAEVVDESPSLKESAATEIPKLSLTILAIDAIQKSNQEWLTVDAILEIIVSEYPVYKDNRGMKRKLRECLRRRTRFFFRRSDVTKTWYALTICGKKRETFQTADGRLRLKPRLTVKDTDNNGDNDNHSGIPPVSFHTQPTFHLSPVSHPMIGHPPPDFYRDFHRTSFPPPTATAYVLSVRPLTVLHNRYIVWH